MNKTLPHILTGAITLILGGGIYAQSTGPSTLSTPYVLPTVPGYETISVLTTDNTGLTPDDTVPKVGGGSYGMDGIPDGLGAFDNGNGTFTLLMNHELGNTQGVVRDHGAIGAYVSRFVIGKNSLNVVSGEDLMKQVFGWDAANQRSNTTPGTFAFNRYCSADLPNVTAFFNPATGLGTQARIYMNGEEGGATGWARGHVVTGPDAGRSYILGKFNLSTNGSGLTGVGAWENLLVNPFPQDKTVVMGNSDGGTGIMTNSVSVYVGTKQEGGSEVDKAGLTNGTLKFVTVAGNPLEIPAANATSRATNITSGTRFTLSGTTSTTFSRPEDGGWNPLNLRQYYFVTTDQLDLVSDGLGTQIGQTRLWRLTFDDLANPDAGGTIDLLIDGRTVNGQKVNMFDNLAVNRKTGRLLLQEDVGNAQHNGKMWEYDPSADSLTMIMKHDPNRFGDRVGAVSTPATDPFTIDKETSGVIDITDIMSTSALHRGNPREAWYISSDQAHYTTGITTSQVEGGQLFVIHDIAPVDNVTVTRSGFVRDRRSGTYAQQITITNNNPGPLTGPFYLALDSLGANATLANGTGTTEVFAPLNSPYLAVAGNTLAPGASASAVLQFANPSNGAITWTARVLNGVTP
jgi:hypothetical protein